MADYILCRIDEKFGAQHSAGLMRSTTPTPICTESHGAYIVHSILYGQQATRSWYT
jgi:hypothetical protein